MKLADINNDLSNIKKEKFNRDELSFGNIENIVFENCIFEDIVFKDSVFDKVVFKTCQFNSCVFDTTFMKNTEFKDSKFINVSFSESKFLRVLFDDSLIISINLNMCTMTDSKFNICKIDELVLVGNDLKNVDFANSKIAILEIHKPVNNEDIYLYSSKFNQILGDIKNLQGFYISLEQILHITSMLGINLHE